MMEGQEILFELDEWQAYYDYSSFRVEYFELELLTFSVLFEIQMIEHI